jgi:acyl carrier protein
VAELPRTADNDIDLRALGALQKGGSAKELVEPRTDLERQIAAIWQELLGIEQDRLDVHDNFFELGGHSLLAAELIVQLEKTVGITLSPRMLFEAPTVAGLAKAISDAVSV